MTQFRARSSAQLRHEGERAELDDFDTGDNVVIRYRTENGEMKTRSLRNDPRARETSGSAEAPGASGETESPSDPGSDR